MLYPQNGDRMVTIDSVTSLYPMYTYYVHSQLQMCYNEIHASIAILLHVDRRDVSSML